MAELGHLVRSRDPETSLDAAERALPKHVSIRPIVLDLIGRGDRTAENVEAEYAGTPGAPWASPQAIRTVISALMRNGEIKDTGRRARTRTGSTARILALHEEGPRRVAPRASQ